MAGKCAGNHRHIYRKDERATDPLEKASKDEEQQRRSETRKRRSEGKNDQSRHKNGFATDDIGKTSKGEENRGNHYEIPNNDPLGGPTYPCVKRACNAR